MIRIPIRACPLAAWMLAAAMSAAPAAAATDDRSALEAEVQRTRQVGPVDVSLRDQAVLHLPSGQMFVPQPTAGKVMAAMGNHVDDKLIGLIYPLADEQRWIVVADFEPAGYVKDDDARDWNADELLQSLKDGTAAANHERSQAGFPTLEVTGWAEKPAYDAATHRLVWAARATQAGAKADEAMVVNYNTYALGREGYVSLNLLTDSQRLDTDKAQAQKLLAQLDFKDGKRYADFDAKTDHIAEYGLAALVAGVAIKKLGLLALMAATVLKFWKLGLIALAGLGSVVPKLFERKPKPPIE